MASQVVAMTVLTAMMMPAAIVMVTGEMRVAELNGAAQSGY